MRWLSEEVADIKRVYRKVQRLVDAYRRKLGRRSEDPTLVYWEGVLRGLECLGLTEENVLAEVEEQVDTELETQQDWDYR